MGNPRPCPRSLLPMQPYKVTELRLYFTPVTVVSERRSRWLRWTVRDHTLDLTSWTKPHRRANTGVRAGGSRDPFTAASRLSLLSTPGEIFLTDPTHHLLSDHCHSTFFPFRFRKTE